MSRNRNKSKTHILIPAGTIDPNGSAILEISMDGARKNQTLVAKASQNQSQNWTRHHQNTTMNYSDFESGLRNDRTQMGYMSSSMPMRNQPTNRDAASFMNSTMDRPRNEWEPTRSNFMPNTLPNYTAPPMNFNATNVPLPHDPLEQTEQEERQALISQLQEYQRARRQYLVSATPAAATTSTFNPAAPLMTPQTPRSIACQACCAYRSQATQTKDHYPCTETRSGPNLKFPGISLNLPPLPNPAWNFPGCSGSPSVSNTCRIKPCYSDSENDSKEYCQLCEKVYNAMTEDDNKDTVELYNRNKCSARHDPSLPSAFRNNNCSCLMSQRELEKVARRFDEIRAKLGICKSLINNKVTHNDDLEKICPTRSCYAPVGRRTSSYETTLDNSTTEDDDIIFERMIQESEKLFKQQKELLQQTHQQLLNDFNRYQDHSMESDLCWTLQSTPTTSKSILKNCNNYGMGPSCDTKRNVTVSPEVETFSFEGECSKEEMRSCPETRQRATGLQQENFEIQETERYLPESRSYVTRNAPADTRRYLQELPPSPSRTLPANFTYNTPGNQPVLVPCKSPVCPHGNKMKDLQFDSTFTNRSWAADPKTFPPPPSRTPPEITTYSTPGNQPIEPCNRPVCPHGKKINDIQFESTSDTIRSCAADPNIFPSAPSRTPPENTTYSTPGNQPVVPCNRPVCPHGKKINDTQFESTSDTIRSCAADPNIFPSAPSRTPPENTTYSGKSVNQSTEPCNKPRCPHGRAIQSIQFDSEKQFAYDLGKASSRVGTVGYDDLYQERGGLDENEAPTKGTGCSTNREDRTVGITFDINDEENENHMICGTERTRCPHIDNNIS